MTPTEIRESNQRELARFREESAALVEGSHESLPMQGVAAVATGSALPSILRLNAHGQLYCSDGREVTTYLREWAKRAGVTEETPLNIMRREDQQRERDDACLARNWAS